MASSDITIALNSLKPAGFVKRVSSITAVPKQIEFGKKNMTRYMQLSILQGKNSYLHSPQLTT